MMNPFRRTLFLHQDGVILTTTLSALRERKLMDPLIHSGSLTVGELVQHTRASAGYLHIALRCLAAQGWLSRHGRPGLDTLRYELTECGRLVCPVFPLYEDIGSFLRTGLPFDWLRGSPVAQAGPHVFADLIDQARQGWSLNTRLWHAPATLVEQVRHHLDGALVTPVMLALTAGGDAGVSPQALRLLHVLGWYDADRHQWTLSGKVARDYAMHYGLVGSYLPTLARLPSLLFGGELTSPRGAPDTPETHVDRRLNVLASAAAHRRYFEDADAIFLELFDREPLAAQPDFVADIGCGDGAWLKHIYDLVSTRTRRGWALAGHPLTVVGIDYNAAALEVARRTLEASGGRVLLVRGDITHPEAIAHTLARHGLDITRGLHIRSFIDHNRRYEPRARRSRSAGIVEPSGAYVTDDGDVLPNDLLQQDLVDFLERWVPYAGNYGLVILEAHCIEPRLASRHLGDMHSVSFDTYHGLSHQYPVDFTCFMQAARTVGLEPVLYQHRRYPSRRPFVAISLNRFRAPADTEPALAGPAPARQAEEWQPELGQDLEDGEALHRLLYDGGDLRRPRAWCAYPTGVLVSAALDCLAQRVDDIEGGRRAPRITVMDYGTGTGLLSIELLKGCREHGLLERMERRGIDFEVWLLDIPSSWFAKGHALLRDCRYTRFFSIKDGAGRFRPLGEVLPRASVDLTVASMVLHLVPPRALPAVFQGIAALLHPDGRFVWSAPDLGPPLPDSVPFHEPNRRLRRRALEALANPFDLSSLLASLPEPQRIAYEGLVEALERARLDLSASASAQAERIARGQILSEPTPTAVVESSLRHHFEGSVSMRTFEMAAVDALDAILVPANQRYLGEVRHRATRETLIRLLMTHDVLPALMAGPSGTAVGFNVCWTFGEFVPRLE